MLDVLNRYAHGFVAIPVILACRRGGVLAALAAEPISAEKLAEALRANLGHLQVSLRLLQSLGWIDRLPDGRYSGRPELAKHGLLADELVQLVDVDMDRYLREGPAGFLRPWIERARSRWGIDDALLADFCDSLLIIPVLALLAKRKILHELPASGFTALPGGVALEVIDLLRMLGWLEGAQDRYRLTPPGEFMFERAMNLGVCESYRPMLSAMDQLLFGDAASVFALDADGRETHVDRSMNVIASGFMHDRYFAEVEQILISIFSKEPVTAQPRYVADMGSGDGTFLKRVYQTVRDKTPRGKKLAEYPLTMIGIDLNRASLEETSATLEAAGIEHVVVTGDIGNPRKAIEALTKLGVDPKQVLHIRSFLDHDRPYIPPADQTELEARSNAQYLGAYADRRGRGIAPAAAVQSLVEHLRRWAEVITEHGFILLEVHCQDPLVVRANMDQTESLYFDAIEGYSQQLLIEADAALMAAAEAGLFPRREYFRKFPGFLPFCRITLNLLERRPYRVRPARLADLPALLALEVALWPEDMRVSAQELARRIETYALGQWVLELNGAVAGVVYSQRVASIDRLRDCTFADLPKLHDPNGSVVQLLGLNVEPQMQHLGLGDQLLDLFLMRSALQGGVRQVAGLTRCKNFVGHSVDELREYVARRDAAGRPVDPVLQFHHSHGARIIDPVARYRPADIANAGCGVLLCYDFTAPGTTLDTSGRKAGMVAESADDHSRLEACLRSLLGPTREAAFSWRHSLRDMGLDSLGLLEFRTLLQQTFGQPLSPTFFFSHPTLNDIERFFRESPAAKPLEAERPGAGPRVALAQPAKDSPLAERASRDDISVSRGVPIAIVGMAGRFAGCDGLDDFWQLLEQGRDAVTEVPRSRWNIDEYYSPDPDVPGKMTSRFGGFVPHHDEFDASFFGISPREAQLMDPQQRLLLELHWEALENAGIDPTTLRETACGFFVGLYSHDYELLQVEAGGDDLGAYYATGNSASIAAGRIAYFLGTRGPALTIDTACSSSLVAVHQAMRSLRSGESDVALASGASLLLSPRLSVAFSKAGMLAPDGRCKTFDAAANGYVRSEGCGVVVLKRLDDAERDGDRVLAVVRGSAVNQDGASNGLTAPSLPAQVALLRSALKDAGISPAEIDYIEAHGTGTSLGDPIEFEALKQVFGGDSSRATPLLLGSVKTNIGHAEAAAGIAGLIKVVLAMRAARLPAHLHFTKANPHIDLDALPARIPLRTEEWRGATRPLRAGVSAFGFSGTNSHVVVEQPPRAIERAESRVRPRHVLALSAKSKPALDELMRRYTAQLAVDGTDLAALCRTANAGRSHHDWRAAVTGRTNEELRARLDGARARVGLVERGGTPRVAFMFTGQGSQYVQMGRDLALNEPAFRKAMAECQDLLDLELAEPLERILYPAPGETSALNDTINAQPALFALEYSLAMLLRHWGVQPAAVIGHSVGEYVAACVAGVFSLEHGLKLISARGRLMQALPRDGAMIAVLGPTDRVRALENSFRRVSIAAFNGPENIVLSGARDEIDNLSRHLEQKGSKVVPLQVSHAFHSPLMEPMLKQFGKVVDSVELNEPSIPLVSNVTGDFVGKEVMQREYWLQHIRGAVRFDQGIRALLGRGIRTMLEVGPNPVLTGMGRGCVAADGTELEWLHTLADGTDDWDGLLTSVARLYELGAPVDWRAFEESSPRRRVDLPGYPWQRRRYWFVDQPRSDDESLNESRYLHQLDWLPRTIFATTTDRRSEWLPASDALARAATDAGAAVRAAYSPSAVARELDEICANLVVETFTKLGAVFSLGGRITASGLVATLSIEDRHARLVHRLLEMLEEERVLTRTSGEFVVAALPPSTNSLARLDALMASQPDCKAELTLFRRCAANLAGALQGTVEPLELLFPDGGFGDAASVYTDAAFARAGNAMLCSALRTVVEKLPEGRTLRILELGAGTGGTTRVLLPSLPSHAAEYVFTDVSRAFLDYAANEFKQYPFVRYELLDAERDVSEQGFAAGQFDVVLASNVVHATENLRRTLHQARALLSPGGVLLLVEGTRRTRWIDLVFGLTEGWWRFKDTDLRPDYPLLAADRWRQVCRESGFVGVEVTATFADGAAADSAVDLFRQGVVIARADEALGQRRESIASGASRHWVVLADTSGVGEAFARLVRRNGDRCDLLLQDECAVAIAGAHRVEDDKALRSTLVGILSGSSAATVIDLWGLDAAEQLIGAAVLEAVTDSGMHVVELIRALADLEPRSVWLVTKGAKQVQRSDDLALVQSTLWGVANVARAEYPKLDVRLLDVDGKATAAICARNIYDEALAASDEQRVAYRSEQRFLPAIRSVPRPSASQFRCSGGGAYLIVGGTGDIGFRAAEWLADRGAKRLALTGRRRFPSRAQWPALAGDARLKQRIAAIERLESRGVEIKFIQADVCSREQVAAAMAELREAGWSTINGVVHVAAEIRDQLISKVDREGYAAVLAPKVAGTLHLFEALRSQPLEFMMLFSSMGAELSLPGQTAYAAANGFLDAFARKCRNAGVSMMSLDWCGWRDFGYTRTAQGKRGMGEMELAGVPSIAPDMAPAILDEAACAGEAQLLIIPLHLGPATRTTLAGLDPLMARLLTARGISTVPTASRPSQTGALQQLLALPLEGREAAVRRLVIGALGESLGMEPAAIDEDRSLGEMGVDSLLGLEFRKVVQTRCGVILSATLVWNYPTVRDIVRHITERLADAVGGRSAAQPVVPASTQAVASRSAVLAEVDSLSDDDALQSLMSGR